MRGQHNNIHDVTRRTALRRKQPDPHRGDEHGEPRSQGRFGTRRNRFDTAHNYRRALQPVAHTSQQPEPYDEVEYPLHRLYRPLGEYLVPHCSQYLTGYLTGYLTLYLDTHPRPGTCAPIGQPVFYPLGQRSGRSTSPYSSSTVATHLLAHEHMHTDTAREHIAPHTGSQAVSKVSSDTERSPSAYARHAIHHHGPTSILAPAYASTRQITNGPLRNTTCTHVITSAAMPTCDRARRPIYDKIAHITRHRPRSPIEGTVGDRIPDGMPCPGAVTVC
jgi:hypothetical protein